MFPKKIEEIYIQIRTKIIDGVYEPSSPIAEIPFAMEYGIKRTRIRQIIQKLESESLIERYPNRGAFVKPITYKDLKEIFELREALESMAARLAARKRNNKDLEQISTLFEEYRKLSADGHLEEKVEIGERLHQFILQSSKNSRIIEVMGLLKFQILRIWTTGVRIPGRINSAFKEHLEILDAIKKRDEELAERKMKKHISDAFKDYIKVTILDETDKAEII